MFNTHSLITALLCGPEYPRQHLASTDPALTWFQYRPILSLIHTRLHTYTQTQQGSRVQHPLENDPSSYEGGWNCFVCSVCSGRWAHTESHPQAFYHPEVKDLCGGQGNLFALTLLWLLWMLGHVAFSLHFVWSLFYGFLLKGSALCIVNWSNFGPDYASMLYLQTKAGYLLSCRTHNRPIQINLNWIWP